MYSTCHEKSSHSISHDCILLYRISSLHNIWAREMWFCSAFRKFLKKVFGTYVHSETVELLFYMLVDKFAVFLGDEIFKVTGNLLYAL